MPAFVRFFLVFMSGRAWKAFRTCHSFNLWPSIGR